MHIKNVLLATLLFSQIAHANAQCVSEELKFTFKEIELKAAFGILADFSGNKLTIDQSIAWSGPMNFECTPWKKVAQDLANKHKLTLQIKNGTMYISK